MLSGNRNPVDVAVGQRILRTSAPCIPSRPMPTATTHRSTSSTKTKKKPNGASRATAKLPAALAARATAAASAKTSRLRRDAHALLALIARRKREITEAFYDIGEALTKLKDRDTISALGRRSFAEVCEKDAGMSVSVAERLVEIVRSLTREQALAMGQKKAMAMVTLAAATPEDDTAAGLYRKKSIALPGGKKVSPRSASANEIEEAATAIRHRRSASAARARQRQRRRLARARTPQHRRGARVRGAPREAPPPARARPRARHRRRHQAGAGGAISGSSTSPSRRSTSSRRRSGAERIHPWGYSRVSPGIPRGGREPMKLITSAASAPRRCSRRPRPRSPARWSPFCQSSTRPRT